MESYLYPVPMIRGEGRYEMIRHKQELFNMET